MPALSPRYLAVVFAPPERKRKGNAMYLHRRAVYNRSETNKRQAIRTARREALDWGAQATASVYAANNALVYQCTVINGENGRPRLRVDEL